MFPCKPEKLFLMTKHMQIHWDRKSVTDRRKRPEKFAPQ